MSYDLRKMAAAFDQLSHKESKWTAFHSILDFALIPHRYYPTSEELAATAQQLVTWPDREIILQFLTVMTDQQRQIRKKTIRIFTGNKKAARQSDGFALIIL
jgi:hypothetical protein